MKGELFTWSNGFFTLYIHTKNSYEIQMSVNINNTDYEANTQFESYQGSADFITSGQLRVL